MKIQFEPKEGPRRDCTMPYEGAKFVEPSGVCPSCAVEPWKIQGGDPVRGHDTISCVAQCTACKAMVGQIIVTISTIFGLEEDDRMLNGRCRVY